MLLALTALAPGVVRGEDTAPEQERDDAARTTPPSDRPLPDYDGRPEPGPDAVDVLLWVPRILFAPVYAVTEYVVRRPLGWAISHAEEVELPEKVLEFFTFGPEQRGAWAPTFLLDFGLRPSVGLFFKLDDAGLDDHDFRFQFATWGPDWLSAGIVNRYNPDDRPWEIQLATTATRRPDLLFYGIGANIQDRFRSRYQHERVTTELRFRADHIWRQSGFQAWAGVRYMDFGTNVCCGDPSIQQRVEQGDFPTPPGFEEGYLAYDQGLELEVDTRRERPRPGNGGRLRLRGSHLFDLRRPLDVRWIKYGGQLAAYLDVTGRNNVFSLMTTVELVESVAGEVPFTELVRLSGNGPMRGFIGGRLIGESGASAVLEYRWPIWLWLDASVHVGVGNVFDGRFDDFALDRLRASWGVGVRTSSSRDHSFDLLIAVGTQPFDEGGKIESVRFVFGGSRDF